MELTKRAATVAVVGLDMEDGREGAFDEIVVEAWNVFGHLDALVNCYAYHGGSIVFMTTILGAERGLHQGAAAYGSCLGAMQQLTRKDEHLISTRRVPS
ncbi:hypothetical protein F3Y22_tig00110633pilonHSYRG00024 [Hibiscus syriacus]|uniref:Uncharacterized protein n=1 Tax=Hibiscus syriacus TaxID=106335 RepID=A0A6A3A0G1_HIBSY|nr:hypothetical protein F3Y22_tig00110633pilonHSYRG00024 [Hibiscus syriacus]